MQMASMMLRLRAESSSLSRPSVPGFPFNSSPVNASGVVPLKYLLIYATGHKRHDSAKSPYKRSGRTPFTRPPPNSRRAFRWRSLRFVVGSSSPRSLLPGRERLRLSSSTPLRGRDKIRPARRTCSPINALAGSGLQACHVMSGRP